MIEGFDDYILELIPEKLFHGGFVLRLYFSVVGKQTNGAKILAPSFSMGRPVSEQLLHGLRAVRTIAQDLLHRVAASANRCQGIANRVASRSRLSLMAAILCQPLLRLCHRSIENAQGLRVGLPAQIGRQGAFPVL